MAENIKSTASNIYFFNSPDRRLYPFGISFDNNGISWSPQGYVPNGIPSVRPENYPPYLPYFPAGTYELQGEFDGKVYKMNVVNPSERSACMPATIEITTKLAISKNRCYLTTWKFEKDTHQTRITKSIQRSDSRVAESIQLVLGKNNEVLEFTLNTFSNKKQSSLKTTSYHMGATRTDDTLVPSSFANPSSLSQNDALQITEHMMDIGDATDGLLSLFSFKPHRKEKNKTPSPPEESAA